MATHADPIPRQAEPYRLPALLQDIRLLDLLELSGSTVQASELLSLSQPTVSRRYRSLAQDFGLERDPRQRKLCRYGSSDAMRWLRMGCRAHRLEAGYARIGADLMHQPLLSGMDWLLPTPVRFRSIHAWAELIREGVIDAALVSGLELKAASQWNSGDLQCVELEKLRLDLAVPRNSASLKELVPPPVMVPHRMIARGLHGALRELGLQLTTAGNGCKSEEQWINQSEAKGFAIAVHVRDGAREESFNGLKRMNFQCHINSSIYLVSPKEHIARLERRIRIHL